MLDLVDPLRPVGNLASERREAGWDEARTVGRRAGEHGRYIPADRRYDKLGFAIVTADDEFEDTRTVSACGR